MFSARNVVVGGFGLMLACSGGTSGTGSSSGTSGSGSGSDSGPTPNAGSGSTAGLDGTWDISSFDEMAEGKMGQMTIANGEISGTIPLNVSKSTSPDICRRTFHQIKFAISVAGDATSGQLTEEETREGKSCTGHLGKVETISTSTIAGKRTSSKPASLTDMNGSWELTIGGDVGRPVTLALEIDGQTFSAGEANNPKGQLKGSIVGNRATATGNRFEFAAQRQ